jgi:AcrR family transcriptional regulator
VSSVAPVESGRQNGPRSRKGAESRARLLDAAKEVFESVGFLEARISDIAERAGLSHGAFYHYFDSKEQIFREVAAALEDRLSAPLGAVILDPSSSASPQERIAEGVRRHLESYRDEARIMGVIEQVSRYDEHVNAVREASHDEIRRQVAVSIGWLQRHGLADPELEPIVASTAIGAMTSRFAEMWLAQGVIQCEFDHGVEQLTRMVVNALGLRERRA